MKQIIIEEKSVSTIIGTLLLISITVILMATVGMFLFSNMPTTNPVKPDMSITNKQISSDEYMIIIDQVTENIKPAQVTLDLTLSNYSKAVMIHLSGSRYYDQYPVLMKVSTYYYTDLNPIVYVNASLVFDVFIPKGLGLAYVSFIDTSTSSMIAENSVILSSSGGSPSYLPWESYQFSGYTGVPSFSTLNSSNIPKWSNASLFQPTMSDGFEYNVSNFEGSMSSPNFFWKNNASFQFPVLNSDSNANEGYGAYFTTNLVVGSSMKTLNIKAYSNETSFIKIYNNSGYYNFKYMNNSVNGKQYTVYDNYTLTLGAGIYVVYIYYFYQISNGVFAFKMTPYT